MNRCFFSLFFLINSILIFSQQIEGVVKDARTSEVLVGASVYIKTDKSKGTTTGLDGSFVLRNVPDTKITLVCSYISYQTIEVEIPAGVQRKKIVLELVDYENELSDVVITASSKTTDISVRNLERISSNTVNIMGARSMELSPDVTVAAVLGRMSGVTLDRNSAGEPEYAILRGMDKRYNITLVNGVKISSPNNKQRFVPLNLFPSELLDRLEVSKSQTADMEGDATGGAVNMIMKDAPNNFSVRANAALSYNDAFAKNDFHTYDNNNVVKNAPYFVNGKDYVATMDDFGGKFNAVNVVNPPLPITFGASVGGRFLGKRIGYILAANFQNSVKSVNSTFFSDEMVQTASTIQLTSMKTRLYSEQQQQMGVHAKFDFALNKNHKFDFYNFFLYNNNDQVRKSESVSFKLSYMPEEGTLDLSYQTRLRHTKQSIHATMLQGEHHFSSKFFLNWTSLYSGASLQRPDQAFVNFDNLRQNNVDNIKLDNDGSIRRWEGNSDRDLSAIVHAKYRAMDGNFKLMLETGALYRNKKRSNTFVSYNFRPVDTTQPFNSYDEINWTVKTPRGSVNPLNYEAGEDIAAAYLQAKANKTNTEIIVGVRGEYTHQNYFMYFPAAGDNPRGNQKYIEFLPNVHIKHSLSENQNLRASYFRSLNRPGFYEIVPYQVINEEYDEYGNPDLKYATINNVDFRWELFPKPTDQLLVGLFYKHIDSPIEFAYFSVNHRQSGYGPQNLGDARNMGIEIDYIKTFRWLGIKANYTYTNSAITTPKVYYGRDENNNIKTLTTNQTRPLAGQAAHVGNLALLLKDTKNGFDAQLAASYTGDRIVIASRFLNSDYYEKASVKLDFSLEKQFGRSGISLFAKANNLLNTALVEYIKTNNAVNDNYPLQSGTSGNTIVRRDFYGRQFMLGFRIKK